MEQSYRPRRFFRLAQALVFLLFSLIGWPQANAQVAPPSGPVKARVLPFDLAKLTTSFSAAPMEDSPGAKSAPLLIDLPLPEGGTRSFRVVESPILSPDFAAAFPSFKTYAVQAVDDPSVTGRVSITPFGFNGVLLFHEGMVLIRPLNLLDPVLHEVSLSDLSTEEFICDTQDELMGVSPQAPDKLMVLSNGATKRTYSLAIVGTGEFYGANGGSVPSASAVVTSSVNGIQAIYERELAVNFQLLTPFFYTNPLTDPFTGADRTTEAAQAVETNFPGGNYDMGHVFHDQDFPPAALPGGGVASLGAICSNSATGTGFQKAAGWSGSFDNVSAGWIKLAAHEFGHMFDMPHTFNGTGGSCTSNISESSAYEIASGNSIMSYAGICSAAQNIPSGGLADHYFHVNSLDQAVTYVNTQTCHTGTATGNFPPAMNANPCGLSYTIPKSTPFRLTGSGTDGNGDQLYYSWEQYDEDNITATPTQGFIGATAAGSSIAPLFRSYPPTTSPTRTFPAMSLVAANSYASDFEPLPSVARTLNFRLTGRDWRTGGGGVDYSPLAVTVSASGPFSVTAPNGGETLAAGAATTVTWSVNGTNAFCTNVNIKLSVDGGLTFPYTLLAATPNDGSQSVSIPAGAPNSTSARVMVECADNTCVVFFDISNANFTLTSACNSAGSNICPTAAASFPAGDPGLSLGLSRHFGGVVTQNTFNISAASPTGPLANATVSGGTVCQTPWGTESYDFLDFAVATTGSYTFTNISGGDIIFSVFTATGYNPAAPCSSTFLGSNASGAISWGSSVTVSLTACTTYKIVVWTLGTTATPTFNVSGTGSVYASGAGPGANYSYTYAAVNTTSGLVAAVNASSNFTALPVGVYEIYGASYYSGAGPTPPTVTPASWIGQSIGQVLSGGSCVLFSTNSKPLTVTSAGGCTQPVVSAPTVTQPTCSTPTGTIVVNATGAGVLEYSVNNGTSWQTSATFSSLAAGSYDIKVRFQAEPSCMAFYGANPVVLIAATLPVVNAPTVTQPICAVTTGTIVVNATGTGALEYSADNGGSWQPSATFSNLAAGNYNIKVRLQSTPLCVTTYAANPVVINAPVSNPCLCNTYCAAGQTSGTCNAGDEFISNVTFNTINNSSTCAQSLPSGYTNYTGIGTSVTVGSSYTLTMTNGSAFAEDQAKAWFDWNANGAFTDAGEEFTMVGSGANNATTWTVSVLVPAGATLGSTRMRVRVVYNTVPTACGNFNYGETEDYCITINSGACTPPTVSAPTVTQPTCSVTTGTIVVNATGSGTLEYSKDNGTNWQTSATFPSLAAGSYTLKVRLQSNPTCMTAYASNPVVIAAVPAVPIVSAPTVTQPTCSVTTGTIVVNATGSGTLEYSKDNGTNWQTSATFSSLAVGSYTLKVRLQSSPTCMTAYASNPVVIAAVPAVPIVSAPTVTQPTCSVTTGTIVVNATGSGTLEYSKDNGTNWQTSATFSSLAAGSYTLKVRLQSSPTCMTAYGSNPVVITAAPAVPIVSAPTVTQPPSCAVQTGTIVVNATGSGTLEYSKDNGTSWQTSATFSSLPAGSYTLKVRLQSSPTCMTAYASNPVVLNAPVGCCNLPTYSNPCSGGDFIQDFTFGTYANLNTGCSNPSASNYTSYLPLGPTVQVGESYTVTIKSGSFSQYYGVYIDFNNNGSFLDAGEFFNIGQANADATVSATVTIPSSATVSTRTLRVRSSYEAALIAADGCNTNLAFGEIEDYQISILCPNNLTVIGAPIPNGPYSADLELTSTGTVANGGSVVFSAGSGVTLGLNFEVALGGVFEILIASCFP